MAKKTQPADTILPTVLLLALPASGKSEVRRYLKHLPPERAASDFHLGPTVQLDDFPYVHLMRRVDDELAALGKARIFFHSPDRPFRNNWDWGTLNYLLNEDYGYLTGKKPAKTDSAAEWLLDRIDGAASKAGIPARLSKLDAASRRSVAKALEKEASDIRKERTEGLPKTLEGKTLVIEFARGGPQGAKLPLPAPLGYEYSVACLCDEILAKASILYVWVSPEESRRKNQARTDPNDPGSILHHGVPLEVMLNDYGCDDMDWLESRAERKGTLSIRAGSKTYHIPIARFDNRVDKTSFLRAEPKDWKPQDVKAVHDGLKAGLDSLAERGTAYA